MDNRRSPHRRQNSSVPLFLIQVPFKIPALEESVEGAEEFAKGARGLLQR